MLSREDNELLTAVKAYLADGTIPENLDDQALDRVRAATVLLPDGADWQTLTEKARSADSGEPTAAAVPLIIE